MRALAWHYWIAAAVLALSIPLPAFLGWQHEIPLRQPLGTLALQIAGWRGRDDYVDDRIRAVLGTDDLLMREYVDGTGHSVGLYVSYFAQQGQGEQSHSPKNCLPGAGWQPLSAQRDPYPLGGGGTMNEVLYEKDGQRQLIFYWFRQRDRIIASEYGVKWWLMWDAMTRHRTDGALLRVSTVVGDSEAAARRRSLAFIDQVIPQVDRLFPR